MKDFIQEIHVEKVSDKIVEQLEQLILEGKVLPGNKLPSERQLIDMLGVGRSSLREAIGRLEMMGYVEVKKRKGIFVKSMQATLHLDPLKKMLQEDREKIIQLYEIRCDLEVASAYAAAIQRSKEDLEVMVACRRDFEKKQGGRQFSWDLDQAFHSSIARGSHNYFRIHTINNIFDFSKEFIRPLIEGFANSKENFSIIVAQHRAILEAIEDQDGERAKREMQEHLAWTNQQLVNYFK